MAFSDAYQDDEPVASINVTPLVDVMLVLLVIFMVTTPMLNQGVEVDLPDARAEALVEDEEPLVLSIKSDGAVYADSDVPIPLDNLGATVKELQKGQKGAVYIKADQALSYGEVMRIMGVLNEQNITKVGLITENG